VKRSFFEDYHVGDVAEFGEVAVDAAAVHEFASAYDPQPIHLDPEAAAASPYRGIIASGWQTAVLTMRMLIDNLLDANASLGSPGIGRLSWLRPVRPGDVLRARATVCATRRSASKPDRGIVTIEVETINARGEVVMRAEDWVAIVRLRDPPAP